MAFDPYSNPGPTRDLAAQARTMPQWNEERFQIQPQRLPVGFKMTTRPKTTARQISTLSPQRIPVMIRSSNQRPAEAGEVGQAWTVSDPGFYDRQKSSLGEEVVDEPLIKTTYGVDANMKGRLVILGGMLGVLAFVLIQKKRGKL